MVDPEQHQEGLPKLTRFEVVRRIGDGGMGVVYEAVDRAHGTRVALKTLHRFDGETLLYLKQEFRSLADIQHPNLVGFRELMRDGDTWFFTMELVDGVDLVTHVTGRRRRTRDRTEEVTRKASREEGDPQESGERPKVDVEETPGTFDEGKLRRSFAQLAAALAALHAAGKIHRDVKPSNVLVTRDGRAVLLDFGLVVDSAGPQHESAIVGTAKYMAPEQALHEGVGPPADWYSFGVVLYECLTGRPPFDGGSGRILERKLLEDPPRASLLSADVPRDLDELCARLLDRDPQKRPTGAEVMRRFAGPSSGASSARGHAPVSMRSPFLGREAELSALRAAFARVSSGESLAVVVQGHSGVGKSALARTFAQGIEASRDDVLVLAGRCYEREVVPYKALDGVMDALCRHLAAQDEAQIAAVFPTHASLLVQVFPALRRIARFDAAARQRRSRPDVVAHESRARLFETVRELFEKLAVDKTLLVLIDDLHWADADSLALLAELVRPPSPRMMLVATARTGTASAAAHADDSPFGLPGEITTLPVGRLAAGETLALAQALLGEGGDEDGSVAAAIANEAEGHPLFVDELVRHALELGGQAPRRHDLDVALAARVSRLDSHDRVLVQMLAVAGVPLARSTAMRAAALEFDAFARSLSVLRVAHLARTGGSRGNDAIEPYHDRVREAVVASLDAATRVACHRALATALEAEAGRDPDLVATHWLEAGEAARAAPYATEAADKAFEALAYDRAGALYERAIPLAASEPLRQRMRIRMGDALASAGRGSDAARAFLAAAEATSGEPALDLRRRAAEELLIAGNVESGLLALRGVLAQLGMRMPGPFMGVVILLVLRAWLALRGLGYKLRRPEDVPREQLLRIDTCGTIGRALTFVDPLLSACFQTRMLVLALRTGEPYRVAYALAFESMWVAALGVRTEAKARRILSLSQAAAKHTDAAHVAALEIGAEGFAALVQGRLGEAVEKADRGAMLAGDHPGLFWESRAMRTTAMWALQAMGDLAGLAARAEPALREAEDRNDVMATTIFRTGNMCQMWLRRGDPRGARVAAERAMRGWTRGGYHNQHWWGTQAVAQADLYEGDGKSAWERLDRDWPRARRALVFLAELVHFDARHLRARAAICAADNAPGAERESWLRRAERDVRWLERSGPPYGAPFHLHLRACMAAVRGDHPAAAAGLRAAIPGLASTPVPMWTAAARWQLARVVGGDEGRALEVEARAFMTAQGIADPERMAALFAPGFRSTRR